jgi:hypothetical protein
MNPASPTAYRAVNEDMFGIYIYAVTDIRHEHYWLPPTYNCVMERRRTRQQRREAGAFSHCPVMRRLPILPRAQQTVRYLGEES